jgi:23S rRNA (cytidine1920-2'-O)/16S rRNA (cytidine1409-2'-O)-methyltransferase
MAKERLDLLLVKKGLVESREKAKGIIMSGRVLVNEKEIAKPGMLVKNEAHIRLLEKPSFVSRGGIKLAHALDEFHLDVNSMVALDIGAGTGGFTDCLLKRGVSRVYAVDVGYGQLDLKIRNDPRVITMERVNARYPFLLPELVDLATIDVSFISVEKILANIATLVRERGYLIVLIKPQFEAGRGEVKKGGLVKDPLTHAKVLGHFISWAISRGFRLKGLVPSPILGAAGNKEFFALLRKKSVEEVRNG